jgi:hypothetical protein
MTRVVRPMRSHPNSFGIAVHILESEDRGLVKMSIFRRTFSTSFVTDRLPKLRSTIEITLPDMEEVKSACNPKVVSFCGLKVISFFMLFPLLLAPSCLFVVSIRSFGRAGDNSASRGWFKDRVLIDSNHSFEGFYLDFQLLKLGFELY